MFLSFLGDPDTGKLWCKEKADKEIRENRTAKAMRVLRAGQQG
jgi:hypothetical protein